MRKHQLTDRSGSAPPAAVGHRLLPHTADCAIEAWGPDRASCLTEALCGLMEEFVELPDAAAPRVLPLAAAGGAEDALVMPPGPVAVKDGVDELFIWAWTKPLRG